mgnify:CR=1 FL=1
MSTPLIYSAPELETISHILIFSSSVRRHVSMMTFSSLPPHVDHTLLSQGATWEEIKVICDDGMKYNAASVCIPASYVRAANYAQ